MVETLSIDPTKKVTHFVAINVAIALHNPNTDWKRIDIVIKTLDKLISINSNHGEFSGAKTLTELRTILKSINDAKARDRLVNMFEAFKQQIKPFDKGADERLA